MKRNRVIAFEPKKQLLAKARRYVDSAELFCDEHQQAVPVLLRAVKQADAELRHEIMVLLGSFAKEESVGLFYEMMCNPAESEEDRNHAAIQLSVMGSLLKDPQPLIDRLLNDVASPDTDLRLHATFALGWRGNFEAATALIERLYDDDARVQQSAVSALCNLKDDRVLKLLLERLDHGSKEQQHAILLNLWRFGRKQKEVVDTYLKFLGHAEADLRFDALACLGLLAKARDHLDDYRKCLKDLDARIRRLAVTKLAETAAEVARREFATEIEPLLNDSDMETKRAALKILGSKPRRQ
jgi:HEAT repeat protein